MRRPAACFLFFLILACALAMPAARAAAAPAGSAGNPGKAGNAGTARLPTGALLDPAGRSFDLGNMPLAMALAPEGDRVVVLLAGWREQGIQVVDVRTGKVLQTLPLPAAFLGLAFAADGRTLYVAGGSEDVVYRFDWRAGAATAAGSISLASTGGAGAAGEAAAGGASGTASSPGAAATPAAAKPGSRFPAGLALSRDGRSLYVAENLADSMAVVDLASGKVVQRLPTGHLPYAVVAGANGEVYVSAWGGSIVSVFAPSPDVAGAPAPGDRASSGGAAPSGPAMLVDAGSIEVGRHPSALLLGAGGARLFAASASTDRVAVVDTRTRRVVAQLDDAPPAGPAEGSTPSALALVAGGRRLLVAESDANAVAVFDLAAATAGADEPAPGRARTGHDHLAGRIPAGWYPTAVLAAGDSLLVANGKGRGTGPNPTGPRPGEPIHDRHAYTLGQTSGTLQVLPAMPDAAALAALTRRVARANGWDTAAGRHPTAPHYPPFRHAILIIKENRTYDQVFGDVAGGDGDARLQFFGRAEAPNHRALAERFGLFDHFLCNGEVSTQGHEWSTAAYATDYIEKTTPPAYSHRRAEDADDEAAALPASGFLWDLARARGLSVRVYGEMAKADTDASGAAIYRSTVPSAAPFTSPTYPAWDLDLPDQRRADAWLAELAAYVRVGKMPALEVMHLPNDHTSGARPGKPTPRAYMADNDLALGRIVEGLSRSPFWRDSVVFVVEDDAQDGADHVDSHRAPLLVVSPYSRHGAVHRFANTTDVLATIEEILGLATLSQFDTFGRPLRGIFAATPDLTPYQALVPAQPLTDRNPPDAPGAHQSQRLDWSVPDAADPAVLNQILWRALRGAEPYPAPARVSTLDVLRAY